VVKDRFWRHTCLKEKEAATQWNDKWMGTLSGAGMVAVQQEKSTGGVVKAFPHRTVSQASYGFRTIAPSTLEIFSQRYARPRDRDLVAQMPVMRSVVPR
jgi:hypothetical protein